MQKKILLFAIVLGAIALVQMSCSTYTYTSRSNRVNLYDVNSNPAAADLDINYQKKVTATSDRQKSSTQAIQQAMYQCVMNNNIDVVVDPIIQLQQSGLKFRATVTGFAGYYKNGLNPLDQVVDKKYKKEDVEKFLLLTDPNFYQYYYQTNENGNVYNIKMTPSGKSEPTVIAQPKQKKPEAKASSRDREQNYAKAKKMRDAGIVLTATVFFCPIGIPLLAVGQKKMNELQ